MRGRRAHHAQRRIHRGSPLTGAAWPVAALPKGWSAPAFFTIKGGSFGLQIGAQAVDLVMLIMNDNGMKNLLSSQFKLGADASVAAGPVGRHAAADTDWKLKAQVLSYSRARGLFAGLELSGAAIGQDKDATREFYGRMVPFKTSLTGTIDASAQCVSVPEHAGQVGQNGGQQVSKFHVGASALARAASSVALPHERGRSRLH